MGIVVLMGGIVASLLQLAFNFEVYWYALQ